MQFQYHPRTILIFVAGVRNAPAQRFDARFRRFFTVLARAEASGMMVAVIVLMLVGVVLSAIIWRLQAYLLRWQQHNMAE